MKKYNPAFLVTFCLPFLLNAQPELDTVLIQSNLDSVRILIDSAEYDPALSLGGKTLDICQEQLGNQDTTTAEVYYLIGAAYHNKRMIDKALTNYLKALDILSTLLDENHSKFAKLSHNIATCHKIERDYEKALHYYKKALKIRILNLGSQHLNVANSYKSIGDIYWLKAEYDKALEYREKTLQIRLTTLGTQHSQVADSYHNIAAIYLSKGDYDRAIALFERVLEIRSATLGEMAPRVASAYSVLALAHDYAGNYEYGLPFHQKALEIQLAKLDEQHLDLGATYLNMGINFDYRGDYNKALEYYQKAQEIHAAHLGDNHQYVALSSGNIGLVYTNTANYEKADAHYQKAMDILLSTVGDNHPSVADLSLNLGINYREKGEYDKAFEYYEKALKIYLTKLGPRSQKVAYSYSNIGNIYWSKGAFDKAKEYYEKALEINLNTLGKEHPDVANSYHSIGLVNEKKGDFDRALKHWHRVLAIRLAALGEDHPDVADSYKHISALHLLKRQYEQAFSNSQKAMNAMDQIRKKYAASATKQFHLSDKFNIFENAIHTYLETNRSGPGSLKLEETFVYSEKAKSNLLLESLHTARAQSFAGIPNSLLEREYNLRVDLAYYEKKAFLEQQKDEVKDDSLLTFYNNKLFDLRQAYENLIAQFETDYPDYYQLKYDANVVSVEDVQSMLRDNQGLVEYFAGDSSLYAFIITQQDFRVQEIKRDFPLQDWVKELRQGLYNYHYTNRKSKTLYDQYNSLYVENALRLHDKLVRPLGDLPEKLIIVPDGVLGYLPFEVLMTSRPKDNADFRSHPYLFRDHQISYNFSATLWRWMRNKKNRARKGLLAFAPSFTGSGSLHEDIVGRRRDLGPLFYNTSEVEAVHQLLGGQLLAGTEATADKFRSLAANHRILHFATHAKVEDGDMDYSFLAFSETEDTLDEDKIFIRDLYDLQLPADLVVLSACETGIGELQRGEGIISLARGFAYAGAKSIVTSLWSANDRSTAEIMVNFYRQLEEGKTKDEALHSAKMTYLEQQSDPLAAHPYYWATFVAIGDMGAIAVRSNFARWWIVGGLLSLCLVWFLSRT